MRRPAEGRRRQEGFAAEAARAGLLTGRPCAVLRDRWRAREGFRVEVVWAWLGAVAHGAPAQCCLACHKKCLDTLAIQCGHKKLQGRLQLFGQDFSQAARGAPDGIPFIVKKCVFEIEQRALHAKVTAGGGRGGSVRARVWPGLTAAPTGHLPSQRGEDARGEAVPGVRGRPGAGGAVPGLAPRRQQRPQALPAAGGAGRGRSSRPAGRGWGRPAGARTPPIRSPPQLPEPILSFRLYHELVGLAKDNLKAEAEAKVASRGRADPAEAEAAAIAMAGRLRELLRDLPPENRATLTYLLRHLRR